MKIESVTYQFVTHSLVRVSWTGTAGQVVWVMLNGEYFAGPLTYAVTARTVDVPVDPDGWYAAAR